ncbi:hypothetical protein Aeh1ORF047c [Aeromonas phage Aeh1]|uniref:Uncharacterized protein n=1 Tax=Aeromonas phage Aeh1 TaxID=2880362 RepID=Q76Z40_9CAUD|nr:hypothetical protein Aeh1p051 [Aeromonas phage Aeh1]AAQ17706.1 hypothetical protein Aeh1ORF047c [Aeromonas phage Aeh1]
MFTVLRAKIKSVFMSKNERLKLKFLDDANLTKYYDLLKLRIEKPERYADAMKTLYKITDRTLARNRIACGVCYHVGFEVAGILRTDPIMAMYRHWDKETCGQLFLIDIKDGHSPEMQYAEERYYEKNVKFYEARLELARHWLDVMTFVDNHFTQNV